MKPSLPFLTVCFLFCFHSFADEVDLKDPFQNPPAGFSKALLPLLSSFEKVKMETTLKGFFVRGDSFPGFRRTENTGSEADPKTWPTESGLCLNVAVSDEIQRSEDRTVKKGVITERDVSIPAGLDVEVSYGSNVPRALVKVVNQCIDELIRGGENHPKTKTP